jgi:hypothetical protein
VINELLKPIAAVYKINSLLLINSFQNVEEATSLKRANKKPNSMMFLALHIIDARCFLLSQFGRKAKSPFAKYVDWAIVIDEIKIYPKLSKVLIEWKKLNTLFIEKLEKLNAKKLEEGQGFEFPGGKKILNMIAFLAEHEAHHVGQIGFLRKYFTG